MDCDLFGLSQSKEWQRGKDLSGYLAFDDGTELSNRQVRKVVRIAIKNGYRKASQLSDEIVREWLNFKKIK